MRDKLLGLSGVAHFQALLGLMLDNLRETHPKLELDVCIAGIQGTDYLHDKAEEVGRFHLKADKRSFAWVYFADAVRYSAMLPLGKTAEAEYMKHAERCISRMCD